MVISFYRASVSPENIAVFRRYLKKKMMTWNNTWLLLGLFFLLGAGCGYVQPVDEGVFAPEATRALMRSWIVERSPTYGYDGMDLDEGVLLETRGEGSYVFEFRFTSASAGYGDRSGSLSAAVLTPHVLRIETLQGDLYQAVTDGVFDEYRGRPVIAPQTERFYVR